MEKWSIEVAWGVCYWVQSYCLKLHATTICDCDIFFLVLPLVIVTIFLGPTHDLYLREKVIDGELRAV